jgi:hypothetical protein
MAGTVVCNTLNTDTGLYSTNNAFNGIAKAWVNFNGVTTVTINASFNVSSVTRNSTGSYTINFTTAFPNIYYSQAVSVSPPFGVNWSVGYINTSTASATEVAPTTTACTFQVANYAGALYDTKYANFAAFSN